MNTGNLFTICSAELAENGCFLILLGIMLIALIVGLGLWLASRSFDEEIKRLEKEKLEGWRR